ncbi:MAG: hypothetical protein PsegKO_30620 [Pseudohongiellaceae bacterium]
MKADFGAGLKQMASIENHQNKEAFLEEALRMSDEQDEAAKPFYELVSLMFQLSELLAKSNYSMDDMAEFSKRLDVRNKVRAMQNRLEPGDEEA